MEIARYVDNNWHHYCIRDERVSETLFTSVEEYKQTTANKKISYIQDFKQTDNSIEILEQKIRKHLEISDHVYVGLGEPILMYKDKKHGWDYDHNCWEGPFYYTDDFINKFNPKDNVTFFANAISHVKLNRPMHYLNDMFFESRHIYDSYEVCKNLLRKLENRWNKKYYWELMCSNNIELYHMLKKHFVDKKTFSTCHKLGISHWGPDVMKPKNKKSGAEQFSKDHNVRCSDLIDPSIYNESFYSCVVETVIPEDNRLSLFSEKQAKPIVTQRPFILVGTKHHLKAFRSLGFKTFAPVIDESYDDEPDMEKRFTMILDAMNKLCEQDPREVYKKLRPVLEYNYRHFYNHSWNSELMKAWFTPNLLSE